MTKFPVKYNQRGFSLLEVLIFASIICVFFVVAAIVATISLRNLKSNENKILATRYAEELLEWSRGQKELDWETFKTTYTAGSPGRTWCFEDVPIEDWPASAGACGTTQKINGIFKRDMILTTTGSAGSETVNVNINVQWTEGEITFNVPLKTVFERFE